MWGRKHENLKRHFLLSIGIILFTIGIFDHYWLTLEEGRFLGILILASISRFLSDPLPIFPIKKAKSPLENPYALLKKSVH